MSEQTKEQVKADGISEFVTHMIAALEAGFIDRNTASLAEIHRVMQNYCLDTYGVKLPHITDQWGEDTAKLCGLQAKYEMHVAGPDDIIEFDNELDALREANAINKLYLEKRMEHGENSPLMLATVSNPNH